MKYLVALCDLEQDVSAGRVSTTALADRLGVSPASVSAMVRRLAQDELVEHLPYRGTRATSAGRALVAQVLHRQAVVARFLVELGLSGASARAEAAQLGPWISDQLLSSIADRLDRLACESAIAAPARQPLGFSSPTRPLKEVVAHAQP